MSMTDFMSGKGEHETGIFATFTGQVVRRRGASIETSTKLWNRDYVVDIEVHVFS